MYGVCSEMRTKTETQRATINFSRTTKDCAGVIVAAGSGVRFGREKQFVKLCGLPLVSWSILAFDEARSVAQIVAVCPPGKRDKMIDEAIAPLSLNTPIAVVEGGATRQESSYLGIQAQDKTLPYCAIHDGARPLVTSATIENAIAYLRVDPDLAGTIAAHRATDTLKLVEKQTVLSTPDRSLYWVAQTPQVFRTKRILAYHQAAAAERYVGTDDACLAEHYGGKIRCVVSPRNNIKVTVPEDLSLAEAVLDQRLSQWQERSRKSGE